MNRKIFAVLGITAFGIILAAVMPVDEAPVQELQLGTIDFPNSGAPEAQGPFIEGVLLLHSFEFEASAKAFQAAQAADPDFGLAYWGEAMTYNHPLWRQQDREAALSVLARYAPTPEARQAKAPTPREAGYLEALDILYGEGSKTERDLAYMAAMGRLADQWPDDHEATTFYSLSILGSTDGERDFATYMRAAAFAQPVFDANPDHPGAAHYIIHSFDDPVHAPLGREAARAYSEIAPGASHAQHMTSHIFVALGMWDEVVAANIRARDVQDAQRAELGRHPNACGHYTSWLHYGWLMKGQVDEAEQGMAACRDLVVSGSATGAEVGYFVNMRARHVLDTEDWGAAERLSADVDRPGYHFVNGYAAVQQGDIDGARAALGKVGSQSSGTPPRVRIMRLELEGLIAQASGDMNRAMQLLTEATEIEEGLPFEFGPPASLKPPHELLGEVAQAAGEHTVALDAFREALDFTPERTLSLEGLVESAQALGRTAMSADAQARLTEIRGGN